MASPGMRKMSFTGSARVGRLLLRQATDTVKRAAMELVGHAPFIVPPDTEIENAAAAP